MANVSRRRKRRTSAWSGSDHGCPRNETIARSTIDESAVRAPLEIEGLCFEENCLHPINGPQGWFEWKLSSSPGPLISDFVTHEQGFQSSTYGIHVGQDDRLTFMGDSSRPIEGFFVD